MKIAIIIVAFRYTYLINDYFDIMKAELKFLVDFYDPRLKKSHKEGKSIEIEIDEAKIPLDKFWREQLKFNDISKSFELNIIKTKSSK
jgi:hypothetical protein